MTIDNETLDFNWNHQNEKFNPICPNNCTLTVDAIPQAWNQQNRVVEWELYCDICGYNAIIHSSLKLARKVIVLDEGIDRNIDTFLDFENEEVESLHWNIEEEIHYE